jgi:two-component system, OmpR family, sensor histidine kinase VicK
MKKRGYSRTLYNQRNKNETIMSAIKRLFGENIKSRLVRTQNRELSFRCVAYNMHRLTKLVTMVMVSTKPILTLTLNTNLRFPFFRQILMDYSYSSSLPYVEEKTEVIYGDENIIDSTLKLFSVARSTLNNCLDSTGPSMDVIPGHPITRAHYEMKERGVRIRYITEITKENVNYCKELMNFSQVRHLDEVKGNFGVLDGIYYRASAKLKTSSPPPLLISSTVRAFVEQQEYFFDMLWKKAIPAKQRIKEIEENLKREFIETIQHSEETTSLITKVLSSATDEILLIFSHAGTLKKYEKLGMVDIVRKKAEKDVEVRILIGTDEPMNKREVEWLSEYPNAELRFLNKSIHTSLTTIVTDRELSLVIEEKGDEDDIDLGLTTYSNSESTVLSSASIFENLWAQSLLI